MSNGQQITTDQAIEEFRTACIDQGLLLPGSPIMDGKLHRVPVAGDKRGQTAGAYVGHVDGIPAGHIVNWKQDIHLDWKASGETQALSAAEREAKRAEWMEEETAREREKLAREERVAEWAQKRWASGQEVKAHPYLEAKGVGAYSIRAASNDESVLLVPMKDAAGKLWSLQSIDREGGKHFTRGGRVEGTFATVGGTIEDGKPFAIAEGYATAATIHEATRLPVAAAFNSGNLEPVAVALRKANPDSEILIAGDNDHELALKKTAAGRTMRNVGADKATAAAHAVAGFVALPHFQPGNGGTDWNDLAAEQGKDVVKNRIAYTLVSQGSKQLLPALGAYGEKLAGKIEKPLAAGMNEGPDVDKQREEHSQKPDGVQSPEREPLTADMQAIYAVNEKANATGGNVQESQKALYAEVQQAKRENPDSPKDEIWRQAADKINARLDYDQQTRAATQRGYEEGSQALQGKVLKRTKLDDLQETAVRFRDEVHSKAIQRYDAKDPRYSALSSDDFIAFYSLGGNKAIREWYFQQKREWKREAAELNRRVDRAEERAQHVEPDWRREARNLAARIAAAEVVAPRQERPQQQYQEQSGPRPQGPHVSGLNERMARIGRWLSDKWYQAVGATFREPNVTPAGTRPAAEAANQPTASANGDHADDWKHVALTLSNRLEKLEGKLGLPMVLAANPYFWSSWDQARDALEVRVARVESTLGIKHEMKRDSPQPQQPKRNVDDYVDRRVYNNVVEANVDRNRNLSNQRVVRVAR